MGGHWTDQFSFVTGAIRRRDWIYLARVGDQLTQDKVDHTYFSAWNVGVWRGADVSRLQFTTVAVTVSQHPIEQGVFLGIWGEVFCAGSGDIHHEEISGESTVGRRPGPFRGARSIEGKVYAVGMRRQAFRRDDANIWTRLDGGLERYPTPPGSTSFEAVDGYSASEVYAVGRRGEIWQFNGEIWRSVDSPTNMILTNVCCAADGHVYACGRLGTLVLGRRDSWQLVNHGVTEEDFWGIAWFNGRLYLSSMYSLYTYDRGELQRLNFSSDVPATFFHLSAADGVLCSIGSKDVMVFDGANWTRID